MRILKNMRNKMVADSKLEGGLAPSYYIEGLLYNVPSTIYGISYENSFVKSINWMMQADRSKFVCANENFLLLNEWSPVTWRASKCGTRRGSLPLFSSLQECSNDVGFHNLGAPMTLTEFRQVFHGPLIPNRGYTQQTAEEAIAAGNADLISFGRPFISNPDLAERFRHGWPLSEPAPISDWYSPTGGKGYTDFPSHAPPSAPS